MQLLAQSCSSFCVVLRQLVREGRLKIEVAMLRCFEIKTNNRGLIGDFDFKIFLYFIGKNVQVL